MLIKRSSCFALLGFCLFQSANANSLTNFNEPHANQLIQALQNQNVHIVQFGDSHTAADVMTGAMRTKLQNRLGNGGMGWGMPMYFSGQRLDRYGYDNSAWQPISSRQNRDGNYTLGGLLAIPKMDGATLTIKAKKSEVPQKLTVSIRQAATDGAFEGIDAQGRHFKIEAPIKDNTWQTTEFTAQLPFTITANNTDHSAIGGWWAKNSQGSGAVVSALGINGAELSFWNRWNHQAINKELAKIAPQLVILAYGTNEAFNQNLDVNQYKDLLTEKIQQIRYASPNTAIMIVAAPESLTSTQGECGVRPSKLTQVQTIQRQVAQQQRTLYWDWQNEMGGSCSMKSWINRGLGRSDGVHFSEAGYQKIGQALANDLLNLANLPVQNESSTPNTQPTSNDVPTYSAPTGSAIICLSGGQSCQKI